MTWLRRLVAAFERIAAALEQANELTARQLAGAENGMERAFGLLQNLPNGGGLPLVGPQPFRSDAVVELARPVNGDFPKAPGEE